MKIAVLIFATVILSSVEGLADTLECLFTEPFISTVYDLETRTFRVREAVPRTPTPPLFEANVVFKATGDRTFTLSTVQGVVIQKLNYNGQGSDGMSDRKFPFEVEWAAVGFSRHPLFGGCALKPSLL